MNAQNVFAEAFHGHLDRCDQCRNHPFDLCKEGTILLHAAVWVIQTTGVAGM